MDPLFFGRTETEGEGEGSAPTLLQPPRGERLKDEETDKGGDLAAADWLQSADHACCLGRATTSTIRKRRERMRKGAVVTADASGYL